MHKKIGIHQRTFLVGLALLTFLMAGCGRAKANPTPFPAQTQVSSPVQTSSPGASAIASQINAFSGQLSAVNGYLNQAQSGLSGNEGDPTK